MGTYFIITAIIILFTVVLCYWNSQPNKRLEKYYESLKPIQEYKLNKYEPLYNSLNIPNKCPLVDMDITILGREYKAAGILAGVSAPDDFYMWVSNDNINVFPCWTQIETQLEFEIVNLENIIKQDDLRVTSIPISKIKYYLTNGDMYTETKISGGGGGGSSIAGAVGGAVLAGGVGAIIGSRKKAESVTSDTIVHDKRITILRYFDDNDELQSINLSYNAYQIFQEWIPEKDFKVFQSKLIQSNTPDIKEKLLKLNELKETQLISEDEYNSKRQELLSEY